MRLFQRVNHIGDVLECSTGYKTSFFDVVEISDNKIFLESDSGGIYEIVKKSEYRHPPIAKKL